MKDIKTDSFCEYEEQYKLFDLCEGGREDMQNYDLTKPFDQCTALRDTEMISPESTIQTDNA